MGRAAWYTITDWLIPEFEGFREHPYWDFQQYTWGYGTRAPGATGTITRAQALQEMRTKLDELYNYLSPMVTRPLNANQWAAYLSFAYNLGPANADNLLANINSGNFASLETQWKKYIYAGGVVNETLRNRRNTEWQIFSGDLDN